MKYEVEFNISINGNRDDIPEFLSEYDLEEPDKSKC